MKQTLNKYKIALGTIAICLALLRDIGPNGWLIILEHIAILLFAALGCGLIAQVDMYNLSVSGQIMITILFSAWLGNNDRFPMWLVILLTVAIMGGIGACYVYITTTLNIPMIVFTFSMQYILLGASKGVLDFIDPLKYSKLSFILGSIGGLPIPLICCGIVIAALIILYRWLPIGKSIFAIGCNEVIAKASGLPVTCIKAAVYAIGTGLIALTGLFVLARSEIVSPKMYSDCTLDLLFALCICRVHRGEQNVIFGSILGAIVVTLVNIAWVILDVPTVNNQILKGLVIIIMLISDGKNKNSHFAQNLD